MDMFRLLVSIVFLFLSFVVIGQETSTEDENKSNLVETPYDKYVLYERNLDGKSIIHWLNRPEYHFINEYKACMRGLPDSFKVALFEYHGLEHIEHIKNHLGRILAYDDYLNDEEGTANHYFHGANNFHESSKHLLNEPLRLSMEIRVPLIQAAHCFSMYKSALMSFSHEEYYKAHSSFQVLQVYNVKDKEMGLYYGSRADLRRDNIKAVTGAHEDAMLALDAIKSIRLKKNGRHDRESMALTNPRYPNPHLENTPLDNIIAGFECSDGYFKEKAPVIYGSMSEIQKEQEGMRPKKLRDHVKGFIYDFNRTLTFASFENPPAFLCFLSKYYETPLI